eukprot:1345129-Rhodomonas_salina.1
MSGTDIGTRPYAISGTDAAYAATRWLVGAELETVRDMVSAVEREHEVLRCLPTLSAYAICLRYLPTLYDYAI